MRDLLPLPLPAGGISNDATKHLARSTQQRLRRLGKIQEWSRDGVQAINELWQQGKSCQAPEAAPNLHQNEALAALLSDYRAVGPPAV